MKEFLSNRAKSLACALLVCAATLVALLMPSLAFADVPLTVTKGDVVAEFVPAGTACVSSDPSVAWVDDNGSLKALKPGTATINTGDQDYTVTVSDYDDGSGVVGNLRILARYNDSMQFYDGHVYLLFTPYVDGVTVGVNDLYGAYRISDQYYRDIRQNIANGSHHTGSNTDQYFSFTTDQAPITLNRGEIVTIGMYRDFDMSVPQAALGCVQNSTLWTSASDAAKTDIVNILFTYLDERTLPEDAFAQIKAIAGQEGIDVNQLLDGVVNGGVCFNRELYNQKLEYDQYENVIYGTDITLNQLNTLCAALNGNLNNFSILKNSCATVALRAWNAAVGTRDGADTAYKIDATGSGIYEFIDAPKSVRDAIVSQLPGYTLNNANGVQEPDASFVDDTGYVYVSAPKKVAPITFSYAEGSATIDEARSDLTTLFNVAKGGAYVAYGENPQVVVNAATTTNNGVTTIDNIVFTMGDQTFTLDANNVPADGAWFTCAVEGAQDGTGYHATDAAGNALPCECANGVVSVLATSLPCSFQIVEDGLVYSQLTTSVINGDEAKATVEFYYKKGEDKVRINSGDKLPNGTQIYVRAAIENADITNNYVLYDVTLNGESSMNTMDIPEGAYVVEMPSQDAELSVVYVPAIVEAKKPLFVQVPVGEELRVSDYAELLVGDAEEPFDELIWLIAKDEDGTLTMGDAVDTLTATAAGKTAVVWAGSSSNPTFGIPFFVQVYDNDEGMVKVEFNEGAFVVMQKVGDEVSQVPASGTKVAKGAELTVVPQQTDGTVVSSVWFNSTNVPAGQAFVANEDVNIKVSFKKASIKGVDSIVRLAAKGDAHQLNAKVAYAGLASLLPVYDPSITYVSSNPDLVQVDGTGKITVVGDVPAEGAVATVTAYAGSSNNGVSASCKVVVGDYQGDQIVGRLTISARPITSKELIAHGVVTFKAYKDIDLNTSYYRYYKPTDEYMNMMADYRDHPENYTSDPALYNNDELGLADRESYFQVIDGGIGAAPQTISLTCGEAVTLSNYGFDSSNMVAILRALEGSSFATSDDVKALIEQIRKYKDGEEVDGTKAFDSLISTLANMVAVSRATGHNPADGHSEGGLTVNRELYNQFTTTNSQMPNHFYTVEVTADELTNLQTYLSDPSNNYYALFDKNCATGAMDIWNATLADRPELALTANITGIATEPESLYFAITDLWTKTGKTYEPDVKGAEEGGGANFYPRTVRCAKSEPEPGPEPEPEPKSDAQVVTAPTGKELTYKGTAQELVTAGTASGGTMVYSLDGKTFEATIPTATDAGTYTVYYKVIGDDTHNDTVASEVQATIAKAPAPTLKSSQKAKANVTLIYDGTKQALLTAPKKLPAGYTGVRYSTDGGRTWKKSIPTGKKAGTYTVQVKYLADKNHTTFVGQTVEAKILPCASALVTTHVQRKGWLEPVGAGKPAGTTGKSLRMEAMQIEVPDKSISGGIEYRSHVQTYGWQRGWKRDGAVSGTVGQSKRLEAVQIRLYGDMAKRYDVYYRVHVQRFGWMGWAKNGQQAGTMGMSRRIEALQVVLVKRGAPAPSATYKGATQATTTRFLQK